MLQELDQERAGVETGGQHSSLLSLPGGPGSSEAQASVSGDFSLRLFLSPTGSTAWGLGVTVTLLLCSRGLLNPVFFPPLASFVHQALIILQPAFPWTCPSLPSRNTAGCLHHCPPGLSTRFSHGSGLPKPQPGSARLCALTSPLP